MLKLFALLFGLLKLGKVGGTVITMLVSLAVYTGIFGWRYAAGFIALLMIHEMGHFIAARQRGLAVSTPTFIPFVGAWIQLKEQPMDVETEAYVASAGPFIGTLMIVMVDGAKELTDYEARAITRLCEQAGGTSLGPSAGQTWWDGKYEPYKKGKLPQPPLVYGTTDTVARFRDIPAIYRARKQAVEETFKSYGARYTCHLSHFYEWGTMLYDRFYIEQAPDDPAEPLGKLVEGVDAAVEDLLPVTHA